MICSLHSQQVQSLIKCTSFEMYIICCAALSTLHGKPPSIYTQTDTQTHKNTRTHTHTHAKIDECGSHHDTHLPAHCVRHPQPLPDGSPPCCLGAQEDPAQGTHPRTALHAPVCTVVIWNLDGTAYWVINKWNGSVYVHGHY